MRTFCLSALVGCAVIVYFPILGNSTHAIDLVGVPADIQCSCDQLPPPPSVLVTNRCQTEPPQDGLVLWYPFESGVSNLIPDASSSGITGTNYGAQPVEGQSGLGLNFDGNDYIALGNCPPINNATALTFGAWIKPSALGTCGIIGKTLDSDATIMLTIAVQNKLAINIDRGDHFIVLVSTNVVHTDVWQHVMCTYDGQQARLFLNGALELTSPQYAPGSIRSNQAQAAVGDVAVGRGWYFQGILDDLRVYERALSDGEVAQLGQSGGEPVLASLQETSQGNCPRLVQRVWTGTDYCGASITATQTITLIDTNAPQFALIPADTTLACGATPLPPPAVIATDSCQGPVDVFFSETTATGCPDVITRTWTASDGCGNTATALQIIALQPLSPPVLIGIPPDVVTNAQAIPPRPEVLATGVCSAAVSPSDLVLYYNFDTSNQVSVTDLSGAGNSGTNHGARWTSDGLSGGAMGFDGNDYIALGHFPQVNGAPALSFGAWVKPTALGTQGIMGKTISYNETILLALALADKVAANVDRTDEYLVPISNRSIRTNEWQHVLCVYDGHQARLYLDGGLVAASPVFDFAPVASNALEAAIGDVAVGRGWNFRGLIDEVRVYRRALSEAEINVLAQRSGAGLPVLLAESTTGTCPRVLTRTWTTYDSCGQHASATQRITMIDEEAPVLSGVPDARSLTCGQLPPFIPTVTALDDGDSWVPVSFEEQAVTGCPGQIIRTWTAVDGCANSTSASQVIEFAPSQPLSFAGVPGNTTASCTQIPSPPAVSVVGGCTGVVSDTGLVLWYTFDATNDLLITDRSGAGNTGTNHGSTLTSGRYDRGRQFDGNDYIALGTFPQVNGATSLSFGAWIKPSTLGTLGILGKTLAGNETIMLTVALQDKLAANVDRDGAFTVLVATNTIKINEWQHTFCVYDGRQVYLYLNGQRVASSEQFAPAPLSSNQVEATVGDVAFGRGWTFQGTLDDIRVYNRSLSEGEIMALAAEGGSPGIPLAMTETWSGDCPRVLSRIWSATDACGQQVAATQLITLADAEAPVLLGIPPDLTIACGDPLPLVPSVTATDACAGTVSTILNSVTYDGCPGTVTRTWTALDACGNSTSAVQVISLHEPAVTNGLILQYLFAQPGLVAVDTSGSGYHGSMTQSFWQPMGSCGGALPSGQGWVTAGPVLDVGGVRTSLCVLVRLRSLQGAGEECIIGKARDQWPLNGWSLRLDSYGRAVASLVGDYPEIASCVSGASLRDERWHVVAVCFQAAPDHLQTDLFIDGTWISSGSYSGVHATVASEAPLLVGNLGPGFHAPFNGLLDEVRIYGRAPSLEEIAALTDSMSACADASRRIQVRLEPVALQQNGAAWQLSDDALGWWYASGDEALVPPSGGLVQFAEVPGWIMPSPISLLTSTDEFLMVTGRYVASVADAIPPTLLSVHPPHDSVVVSNSAVVTVTASDNSGVAWVTVNGLEASWIGSDDYRVQITGLRGLYNNVHLEVADISGNLVFSNINYRQATDLSLTALWDGKWELDNPYSDEVIFQWQIRGGITSSATNAPPRAKTRFNTPKGSFILDILVGGDVVLSEESSSYPPPPMAVSDGSLDSDLDGVSNFEEDLAGTDINDALSVFALDILSDSPDAATRMLTPRSLAESGLAIQPVFRFRSSTDHEYTLESSMDAQTWSTVMDFYRIPGTGGDLTYTNRVFSSPTLLRIKANKRP